MRCLLTLITTVVLTTSTMAAPKSVDLRWYGHSCFLLESTAGTRIVFDPHNIPDYFRPALTTDILLISHEHDDHNQLETVRVRNKANTIHGLQPSKDMPRKLEWHAVETTIADVHVRSVGTYHDMSKGMQRGLNTIFVVELDGLHIVHLGDLGHPLTKEQVAQIGPIDVLMIPVGGVYTLNGSEAKEVVAQLKPRLAILPMHYGTRAFEDVLPPDEFLDDIPRERIRRLPGNKLSIDPERKPPAEPLVYLLGWK